MHLQSLLPDDRRDKVQAFAAFALFALLLLAVQHKHAIAFFPHDAGTYWALANDPSSLPAHAMTRGYFFPTLLGSFVALSSAVGITQLDAFRLFSSLVYSAVLTVLVPNAYRLLAGGQANMVRRLWPAILLALAFPGLFLFPLSDLPALALMWCAVDLLLRSAAPHQPNSRVLYALLAGIAAGAAYNTRTIYLFSILPMTVALPLLQSRLRWARLASFVAGAVLVSLPQLAVNLKLHDIASVDPTAAYRDESLFLKQLLWGMRVQKYETYLVDGMSGLRYRDPAGEQLLARVSKDAPINSVWAYLQAALRNPLPFLGLYGRHVVNGLDVRDGRQYLTRPPDSRMFPSFACISAVLVALLAILTGRRANRPDGGGGGAAAAPRWLCSAALIAPALLAVPGAIETRFFLPLLAFLYTAAAGSWSTAAIAAHLKTRFFATAALALVAYALFFAVSQSTLAQIGAAGATRASARPVLPSGPFLLTEEVLA